MLRKNVLFARTMGTRDVDCVLLNSVQSEANFAELTLLQAIERNQVKLPLIEVDFAEANEATRCVVDCRRLLRTDGGNSWTN